MKRIFSDNRLNIVIRPAESDDAAFFRSLYVEARRNEFAVLGWSENQIQRILNLQFDAQTQGYGEQFPDLRKFVIEVDDEAVGRMLLTDEIRLVDIAVLPISRNLGIGGFVLNRLLDEAENENKSVCLQVLKTNSAAQRLYERFGFENYGEDDLYLMMQRPCLSKK